MWPHLGQGVEHGVLLVLLERVAQARKYQHAHTATVTSEQSEQYLPPLHNIYLNIMTKLSPAAGPGTHLIVMLSSISSLQLWDNFSV